MAGGILVLTSAVVDRLVAGLKAGVAEREAAKKEETPCGRYVRAQAANEVAKPKCEAAQQPGIQRLAANQKMMDKYSALIDKMVAAQSKQDLRTAAIYRDDGAALSFDAGQCRGTAAFRDSCCCVTETGLSAGGPACEAFP